MVDDKGASAIIAFGLPGNAHEDDAERAVRAALALQSWFKQGTSPFACGIAAGRTFCGDPGLGKSRLLRELERACASRGILVLSSAAGAVEESTPLWVLRGILSSIADTSTRGALRSSLQNRCLVSAADIDLLWTNLFGLSSDAEDSSPVKEMNLKGENAPLDTSASAEDGQSANGQASGRQRRLSYQSMHGSASRRRLVLDSSVINASFSKSSRRLFGVGLLMRLSSALSRLFQALECEDIQSRRKLALFIEDSHWMDSSSWFVVRCIRDTCPRLLLVISARPKADPSRDYLLLSGQLQLPNDFVDENSGDSGNQMAAVLKLMSVIGINFTCEAVIAADPSGLSAAAVHKSFRQLCRAGLIGAAKGRLSLSTTPNPEFGSIPEGVEGNVVDDTPASPSSVGWPSPGKPFVFLHALVCDAVYGSMSNAMRRDVHRRVARWTEACGGVGSDDPAVLMVHWREAGEPKRFAECLGRAARRAYHKNALPEAKRLFCELVATIDTLKLAGPNSSPLPSALRPSKHVSLREADSRDSARVDERDYERWRTTRAGALRHWAFAEFFSGNDAIAGALAVACIEGLGERLPSKPATALDLFRALFYLVKTLRKYGKAEARPTTRPHGQHWLQRPERGQMREALMESLLVCAWIGLRKETFEGRGGFAWVIKCITRALEISEGTPEEMLGVADARVLANFSSYIQPIGFPIQAQRFLARAHALSETLGNDSARSVILNHSAMQFSRDGRYAEAAALFRRAAMQPSPQPNSHEFFVTGAVPLLFIGSLEEARGMLEDAKVFASRLGVDRYGAVLASMVGALLHVMAGRDAQAAAQVQVAEEAIRENASLRWWAVELLVLAWRKGDKLLAAECVEAARAIWLQDRKTLSWVALLLPVIVVDYALASRAEARAALAAAEAASSSSRRGIRSRIASLFGLGCRVATGQPPAVASAVSPLDVQAHAHAHSVSVRDAALASKKADLFARQMVSMMEEDCRRRLPTLAPFCELARAEEPGLAPARRLQHLRTARDAFGRLGMRPFEALAWLRLSRAEPRAAAAAEAAAAAVRIAEETGMFIPALRRPAAAAVPWSGDREYVSIWV
eukprot:tig00020592_g11651.t1